jgi:hypothetical protein
VAFANVFFSTLNGFSAYSIYDNFYFSMQNTLYTVIMPVVFLVYDQAVPNKPIA